MSGPGAECPRLGGVPPLPCGGGRPDRERVGRAVRAAGAGVARPGAAGCAGSSARALAVMAAAAVGVVWRHPVAVLDVAELVLREQRRSRRAVPGPGSAGRRVRTVIVSSGVAGRFYDSRSLYVLSLDSTAAFRCAAVTSSSSSPTREWRAGSPRRRLVAGPNSVARSELHAERLVSKNCVDAYLWHPPAAPSRSISTPRPDRPAPVWLTGARC